MALDSLSMMDRKSSIEEEPLTLPVQQLRFAREAASYVMNTMSVEDALRIFTEGLEPPVVGGDKKEGLRAESIDSEDQDQDQEDGRTDSGRLRDIVSAPF